jgi:hypothetical protein
MRGAFEDQGGLFSYISPEARIPASHPLRKIRELVREVLGELNRSIENLSSAIGGDEETTAALLLEIGARKSMTKGKDNWALVSRVPFPDDAPAN